MLLVLGASENPLMGRTLSRSFGGWIVDCTLSSLDPDGHVQCGASATISDIHVSAQRDGDLIKFDISSEQCPGLFGRGEIATSAFEKRIDGLKLKLSGQNTILAAMQAFRVSTCGLGPSDIDGDRQNMDLAFQDVLSRLTPEDFLKPASREKKK